MDKGDIESDSGADKEDTDRDDEPSDHGGERLKSYQQSTSSFVEL